MQPTRLPRPWILQNTGVGCHCLLQCMKVKSESEVAQSCRTLCHAMDCSLPGSSVHGILQARITGVGCHALLQGIFLTQGSNPCLLHWQVNSFNTSTTWEAHLTYAAAAAKSLQSCPTPGNPIDGSPPGSPVPGILQARTLEWVATAFSNA